MELLSNGKPFLFADEIGRAPLGDDFASSVTLYDDLFPFAPACARRRTYLFPGGRRVEGMRTFPHSGHRGQGGGSSLGKIQPGQGVYPGG